jgi:phosphinothricin acetyltransferase
MTVVVRDLAPSDWPAVEAIYREGIATGNATFERQPPSWDDFERGKVSSPRLVAVQDGRVVGWAAASLVSSRSVYEGVLEHSIYVSESARGSGVGSLLLGSFIDAAEAAGFWTIQSGVFPENESSLALHHKLGFRDLGVRERVGRMSYGPHEGRWRDVVLIERRSNRVGND